MESPPGVILWRNVGCGGFPHYHTPLSAVPLRLKQVGFVPPPQSAYGLYAGTPRKRKIVFVLTVEQGSVTLAFRKRLLHLDIVIPWQENLITMYSSFAFEVSVFSQSRHPNSRSLLHYYMISHGLPCPHGEPFPVLVMQSPRA